MVKRRYGRIRRSGARLTAVRFSGVRSCWSRALKASYRCCVLVHYRDPTGMTYEDGDLDGDGDVNRSDLAALQTAYGTTCV
jgi:hypothetical protein